MSGEVMSGHRFTYLSPLRPLNIPSVNFRFLLPVWGSAPKTQKRKIFDLVLTPTEVHLVDHVSPEGRSGEPLTFPEVWGAYCQKVDVKAP